MIMAIKIVFTCFLLFQKIELSAVDGIHQNVNVGLLCRLFKI